MQLRAGLIGYGSMGRNHARVLGELAGVDLVGIADPNPSAALPVGVTHVKDVANLISLGIDYAVVVAPTNLHESIALQLAENGVHALIEKPVAASGEAARRIENAFTKYGLVGGVGHIERYNPAMQAMRQKLEMGVLGDVYQIVTRRQGPFPPRIADVGVILDLASHDIDMTSWISYSTYETISAHIAYRSGREHEDLVSVSGQLHDGTVVNHLVNWVSPLKERLCIVTGEKGTLVADTITGDLTLHNNPAAEADVPHNVFSGVICGDMVRYAIAKPEPLKVEHETFRDAVLGKDGAIDQIVDIHSGVQVVKVAEALLDSAISQREVTLEKNGIRQAKQPAQTIRVPGMADRGQNTSPSNTETNAHQGLQLHE